MVTAQAVLLAFALAGSGETVLLDFTASWCGPCRSMEPAIRRLVDEGLPVRQVDVDQHPNVAAQFRVTGLPTFIMLVDGREVDRVMGPASDARLRQMLALGNGKTPRSSQVRGQSPDHPPSGAPGLPQVTAPDLGTTTAAVQPNKRLPQAPNAGAPTGNPIAQALAATVRIKVEDATGHSIGSGTIIDQHGQEALVVTCGHIFRESAGRDPITVEIFDGQTATATPAQLVSYDLKRDIGMISFTPPRKIVPVRVAPGGTSIRTSARVFSIGCNHGANPSVQQSHITAIDKYTWPPNIEVAGQPVQGRSGGGLFTAAGELIGICNFADPADNEGIYASLATIHWELDRIGQRQVYQPQAQLADHGSPAETAPNSPLPTVSPDPAAAALDTAAQAAVPAAAAADMEVICIIRSRSQPNGPSQVFVLNQPPQTLLDQLARAAHQPESAGLVPVEIARSPRHPPVIRAQSEQ